jgi:hypothetical protein
MGTTLGGDGLIDGAVLSMVKTQDATLPAFSQLAQTVQPHGPLRTAITS